MNDYEPLDISALCNAGLDALSGEEATPTGSVTINGLPFQIGRKDGGDRCFVVLHGSSGTLKLDVERERPLGDRRAPAPGVRSARGWRAGKDGRRVCVPARRGS